MKAISHNATFASWRKRVRVSSHAPFVQRRRWLRHLPSLWPWAVNTKNPDAHPFACCPWRALEGVRSTGDSARYFVLFGCVFLLPAPHQVTFPKIAQRRWARTWLRMSRLRAASLVGEFFCCFVLLWAPLNTCRSAKAPVQRHCLDKGVSPTGQPQHAMVWPWEPPFSAVTNCSPTFAKSA